MKERGRKHVGEQSHEAQMIGALKQLEASRKAEDMALEVGVSKHTISYRPKTLPDFCPERDR